MAVAVEVGARAQQHQVGLWFVESVEAQGALDPNVNLTVGEGARDQLAQQIGCAVVRAADRGHVDDLPLDQLDAVPRVRMPASAMR